MTTINISYTLFLSQLTLITCITWIISRCQHIDTLFFVYSMLIMVVLVNICVLIFILSLIEVLYVNSEFNHDGCWFYWFSNGFTCWFIGIYCTFRCCIILICWFCHIILCCIIRDRSDFLFEYWYFSSEKYSAFIRFNEFVPVYLESVRFFKIICYSFVAKPCNLIC